jgi:hypothetical protein
LLSPAQLPSFSFPVVPASRSKTTSRRLPPKSARAVVEQGFIPVRAKLIDLAAFLDRVERHGAADDFRCEALRRAARLLIDGKPERARRILESFSDLTTKPAEMAGGKAALGAWQNPTATKRK